MNYRLPHDPPAPAARQNPAPAVDPWLVGLDPDRLDAQLASRARMSPPVIPAPAVDPEPHVVRYRWYWSLTEKERAQVDADNEAMLKTVNYV